MAVNQKRVRLLVNALRSGNYEQDFGQLGIRNHETGGPEYCCLGVACELAVKAGVIAKPVVKDSTHKFTGHLGAFIYDGETEVLPDVVSSWFGFAEQNPLLSIYEDATKCVAASVVNDELGWSFAQIADAFEHTFLTGDAAASASESPKLAD